MKKPRIFIFKAGMVKAFPLESWPKHKAALAREGWREATRAQIEAAGFKLEPLKPKPIKAKQDEVQEEKES